MGHTVKRVLSALVIVAGCSGCAHVQDLKERVLGPDTYSPQVRAAMADSQEAATQVYRVGPEDVLEISVWKEDNLKREVTVRPDGGISFPLAGELKVAGQTPDEIRKELSDRLEKFIPEPAVSVLVLKAAAYRFYVIGRVNKPGDYTAGRPIDVLQALSMAGGMTPFADDTDIRVVRSENGKSVVIPFDYQRVQRGKHLEENVELKSGDVVVVP